MVKWLPNETVAVYGYAREPVKVSWQTWMKWTHVALSNVERAIAEKLPRTRDVENSMDWLKACGVDGKETFYGMKERLALLAMPGDPSRIVRCRCCNVPLSDPVSKVLGIGPICRDPRKSQHTAQEVAQ